MPLLDAVIRGRFCIFRHPRGLHSRHSPPFLARNSPTPPTHPPIHPPRSGEGGAARDGVPPDRRGLAGPQGAARRGACRPALREEGGGLNSNALLMRMLIAPGSLFRAPQPVSCTGEKSNALTATHAAAPRRGSLGACGSLFRAPQPVSCTGAKSNVLTAAHAAAPRPGSLGACGAC